MPSIVFFPYSFQDKEISMQQQLTGRALHEAFLAHYPMVKTWDEVSVQPRLAYEQVAHTLNIQLGLLPATQTEYLFIYDNEITQASTLDGLLTLITVHIDEGEAFEIVLLRGGRSVGHRWYEMHPDRVLFEWTGKGEAVPFPLQPADTPAPCCATTSWLL